MNSETFRIKYLSLADTLYKVAFYILESECDAKDAVQDLYLKLWRDRDRLDAVVNPKAYCITFLKNRCIDLLRQSSRTDRPAELPGQDDGGREEQRLHDKERLERVLKDIGRLPQKQREVLTMRTIEGLDYDEISERTGMSTIMLRVLLSKARRTLRQNETHTNL
ncbi:MAG: RNA polymerase sigma factor [Candidatus Cryptobacteroides sp.]